MHLKSIIYVRAQNKSAKVSYECNDTKVTKLTDKTLEIDSRVTALLYNKGLSG